MVRKWGLWAVAAVLTGTGLAPAQQTDGLDLIPADVAAAVAIRGLDRLKEKGDKLIADAKLQGLPRPSELFAQAYNFLGIQGQVDAGGSAAIVLARPEAPAGIGLNNLESLLVGILPFTDRDKLAAAFGIKPGQLQPGKVMEGQGQRNFGKFVLARGKHLYIANDAKTLARVAKAKTLRAVLSAERRQALEGADVVAFVGPPLLGDFSRDALGGLEKELAESLEPGDVQVVGQLTQAIRELRFGLGAFRLDGGVSASFLAVFPEKQGEGARKLFATLGGDAGPSSLKGLPKGPLVVAQALSGRGTQSAVVAKAFFHYLLKGLLEPRQILSATNRPVYLGVFDQVWQRLQGSRAALYQTDNETKLGLFSLVAILDTKDADRFLADMRVLARIADTTAPDQGGTRETVADPAKLVGELGDARYRVRELASLKLRLLGDVVLPSLKKAMASDSAEVARRAKLLWEQISQAAAERRKELLAKELPRHLRPILTFSPRAETLAGHRIDVIRIKLGAADAPAKRQLRQLLGPDWDRVRLAVHGKQIVVLFGSETALLEKALANLKEGKPGLAEAKELAVFRRQASATQRLEFHVSVQRLLALTATDQQPGPGLTSFALNVGQDTLQLDVTVPSEELRVVAGRMFGR